MSNYKSILTEFTVEEALDTTEIEDLRDEMQGWIDNMSGTALENTNRYSRAEDAVAGLDGVNSINFDEIWEAIPDVGPVTKEELLAIKFTCQLYEPKSKKQKPSRAYRLSNAINHIITGLQEMRDYLQEGLESKEILVDIKDLLDTIDEIESNIQDLDSVEFPSMFG